MKKIFRKEVLIGALVILAMAILFVGIDFLKGINVFKTANYYYATYDNVNGLAISAPVTVNGFKVGQVREINYQYDNPGHVAVEMSLDRQLRVPRGSRAVLVTDLLGTASITLELAHTDQYQEVGDTLAAVVNSGLMDGLSQDLMPSISSIFPKVDSLLSNLNTLIASQSVSNSVERLDAITNNLETTTIQLNHLLAALAPTVRNVNSITTNVDSICGDLTVVSHSLSQMPLDSITADLAVTVENLRTLSAQLNDPDSSLGKLTHDPELYNSVQHTVASLDSLFVDIKRSPKRYVTVKIF